MYEAYGIQSSTYHHESEYPVEDGYADYPLVKTHLLPHELEPSDPGIPAVYLVRDGRDSLVSMAHQRSEIVKPGSDYYKNLRRAIVAKDSHFGGWSRNVMAWLDRASIVIRFEDLIVDPIVCIERLRPLIDLPEPAVDRVPSFADLRTKDFQYGRRNLEQTPEERNSWRERFFRRGVVGGWRTEMPPDMVRLFWKHHGDAMRRLGYLDGAPGERWWLRLAPRWTSLGSPHGI
jgi:hypothetical protein